MEPVQFNFQNNFGSRETDLGLCRDKIQRRVQLMLTGYGECLKEAY
jgi:hypothetical protein